MAGGDALSGLDQVVAVLHFLDECGKQFGGLFRVGGECGEAGSEGRQFHAALAVDADEGNRLRGESGDQVAQVHGLAGQGGAEGELVRDGAVVAYERGGVLAERDWDTQVAAVDFAGHLYAAQDVVADEPEFDDTGLDGGYVDGVNAPGMPQPFGGRSDVGRFLARGEPEPYPQAGRGGPDEAPAGRDGPYLSIGGGLDREDPQPRRSDGQAARLHDGGVRAEQPGRGDRQADGGPVDGRVLGPGVGGPAAECGDRTTHLQERCYVGHQAAAPVAAAGKAAGVMAAAR